MIFIYAHPNRVQASLDSKRIVYLLLLFDPSARGKVLRGCGLL